MTQVGGSNPPLTTPHKSSENAVSPAAIHLVVVPVTVPARTLCNRLATAVARSLLHVGCTALHYAWPTMQLREPRPDRPTV
jgi:hypothetical protein